MSKHQNRFTYAATTSTAVGRGYSPNEALRALVFWGQTTFSRDEVKVHHIDAETGDLHETQMTKEDILGLIDEVAEQMESEVATLRRSS